MIAADFEAASRAVPYDRANLAAYREAQAEIRSRFAAALADEHLPHLPDEATDAVFERAWEEGHSSGFHSVEGSYADLAALIEKVERFLR